MNIIKGIDRIAIVLAVVSIIPGFISGVYYYDQYDIEKKDSLKEKLFEKYLVRDIPEDPDKKIPPEIAWELAKPKKALDLFEDEFPPPKEELQPEEDWRLVKYAPRWHLIIAGIASSISTFLIVLFSVCGISRVLKHISLWIVDGFKDENKSKNNP
ncbi:MAG: hypothetical protein J7K02_04805 [Deltaproteobacteria bacterium]|nr:hypothetical protein [Deltaproteobacteria bacterium]